MAGAGQARLLSTFGLFFMFLAALYGIASMEHNGQKKRSRPLARLPTAKFVRNSHTGLVEMNKDYEHARELLMKKSHLTKSEAEDALDETKRVIEDLATEERVTVDTAETQVMSATEAVAKVKNTLGVEETEAKKKLVLLAKASKAAAAEAKKEKTEEVDKKNNRKKFVKPEKKQQDKELIEEEAKKKGQGQDLKKALSKVAKVMKAEDAAARKKKVKNLTAKGETKEQAAREIAEAAKLVKDELKVGHDAEVKALEVSGMTKEEAQKAVNKAESLVERESRKGKSAVIKEIKAKEGATDAQAENKLTNAEMLVQDEDSKGYEIEIAKLMKEQGLTRAKAEAKLVKAENLDGQTATKEEIVKEIATVAKESKKQAEKDFTFTEGMIQELAKESGKSSDEAVADLLKAADTSKILTAEQMNAARAVEALNKLDKTQKNGVMSRLKVASGTIKALAEAQADEKKATQAGEKKAKA